MENYRKSDITGIPDAIIRKLMSSKAECVLPFSVLLEGDSLIATFSVNGMIEIGNCHFSAINILELCGRIITMLEELKDYLIWPEEIVLNKDVIFIDKRVRMTRLCLFVSKSRIEEKDRVSCLLKELIELTDEKGKEYLEFFINEYMSKHFKAKNCISLIEELKREIGAASEPRR